MSSENEIEVKVSAESSQVKSGMSAAADAVKEGVEHMKGQLEGLGGALESVFGHIKAFTAIIAGGALFKEGIGATKDLTRETVSLSKQLGVSTDDASTLNVALKSIGSSADTYTAANAKLTRQIRSNEEAVQAMGVKTRGANGELLDGQEIMTNAITALKGYKEGTDRNLAAQELFGRGAAEMTALLKLNTEVMDKAKVKAEELGLVIGPKQAAMTKAYKEGMEEIKLVVEALENQIGQAVMPALTRMAEWFAEIGPTAVAVMREAMQTFKFVLDETIDTVEEVWKTVSEVFKAVGEVIGTVAGSEVPSAMRLWQIAMETIRVLFLEFRVVVVTIITEVSTIIKVFASDVQRVAQVIQAALSLNWDKVADAWQRGTDRGVAIVAEGAKKIQKLMADTQAEIDNIVSPYHERHDPNKSAAAPYTKPTGKSYHNPNGGKNDSDKLKAEYAVMLATLEGQLAVQREYLKESQEAFDYAYRHNLMSIEDYYAQKLSIERQGLNSSIQIKEEEIRETQALEARATKPQDKLGLKAQEIRLTAQLTVLQAQQANAEIKNSREVTDALNQRKNALAEIVRVSTQQAATSGVDMDRINMQKQVALRQATNAEMLQQEKDFENRMYQINLEATRAKLELIDNDPVKRAQINAEIEQLERQHQVAMANIDKDIAVEKNKDIIAAQDAIEASFESTLSGLMSGTETLKQAFKSLVTSVLADLAKLAAKKVATDAFGALTGAVGGGGNSAGWLGSLLGGVASYDVGTSYVPKDGLAMIHKGERVVTAKDNASGNFGNGGTRVTNNFNLPGATDRRTQQNIALAALQGAMVAQRRNA